MHSRRGFVSQSSLNLPPVNIGVHTRQKVSVDPVKSH